MPADRFADTDKEIARVQQGRRPPVAALCVDGARLTPRWRNTPFDAYVPGLKEHVVSARYGGTGTCVVESEGRRFRSCEVPGTVSMVPMGHDGHYRFDGTAEVSTVLLSQARLDRTSESVFGRPAQDLRFRLNHDDAQLFAILRLVSAEVESPHPQSGLFLEQAMELLCLQLLRAHSTDTHSARTQMSGLPQWLVNRVTDYMRAHLSEAITLQDLANLANLSRYHFCTAFRLATGRTPHDHLTALRMDRARRLLRDPGLRIIDVAFAVGYQTASAFSSAFHRVVGATPSQFRQRI